MRAGAGWDAACLVALLAPLAGVAAPLGGPVGRAAVVRAGRSGSLVAVALFAALAAGRVQPTLGAFEPDLTTLAAMAGAALVAAVLAVDPVPGARRRPVAALAPPSAALTALGLGVLEGPTDLSPTSAGAAVVVAGAVSVAVAVLAAHRRGPEVVALAAVLLPAALLVVLRAGRPLLLADPESVAAAAGPAAALVAGAAAVAAVAVRRWASLAAATGPALVVAAALAPLSAARPVAGVLAAGAVLHAVAGARWSSVALAPGLAVLATVAADLPAPDAEGLAHGTWALGISGAAIGLAWASWTSWAEPTADAAPAPAIEARAAVGLLVAWLVLVPGRWAWADPPVDRFRAWERAAAVAATTVLGAGVLLAARQLRPKADREVDGRPG